MTSMQLSLATLLALGAAIASVRYSRSGARHRFLLAALQPVVAFLLYLALAAPPRVADDTLVVLTEGTPRAARDALLGSTHPSGIIPAKAAIQGAMRIVALPESDADARIEPAPDLATALRRHSGIRRITVHGTGLVPRDLDAARGIALSFVPTPQRAGIVEIPDAITVAAGRAFSVAGRVVGVAPGTIELRDPGDTLVASVAPTKDGRFAIVARSRQPGATVWRLRLLDSDAREVEALDLAIDVIDASPLRIGVLAGSVSPELKYFRRWARDAGHELRSRLTLGGGMETFDAPLVLDAQGLATLDLLVVDERGWAGANAAERDAIVGATRAGLGLLLRITGPVPPRVAAEWRALGLEFGAMTEVVQAIAAGAGVDAPPALRLIPVVRATPDAVPIQIEATIGGWWRALGLGRVALWRVADSHRLVTAGHGVRHAELWASVAELLARARGEPAPELRARARVGERAVICGLDGMAQITAPNGRATALVPVAQCAAWWPREAGWHALSSTPAQRFHVLPADVARAWVDARNAAETARLAEAVQRALPRASVRPPAWLMLALAFALLIACWLLERRALGAAAPAA